jgi:hypothetical protein
MAWRRSLALGVGLVACKQRPSKLDLLDPPAATARLVLDGELDEPAWNARAVRGVFAPDPEGSGTSAQARPYSEIRVLRDATHLVIGLYAADEDIRSTDAFEVTAGALVVRLTAAGRATPATVRVAVDRDGTLDDPRDDDEEWVVEAELPLDALGPWPVAIEARRCDITKDGVRRCGAWHGTIEPGSLPRVTDATSIRR